MLSLPSAAEPLFVKLSVAFTRPTFQRILPLCVGAILAMGQRTVTALLWTMRGLVPGHPSTYHRVFSRAVWSLWPLGKVVAAAILRHVPANQPVLVPMDDTTAQHRGKKVYGKGCHHDAVRSSHKQIVYRWGHRWVVLAISVKFPFTSRRWALPVLAALYRPRDLNEAEGRRHKTAPDLARQLMATLIRWFPARTFVFLGDGGYASHELARFCFRHHRHATLVSRFHGDANLYAPPPKRQARKGRPRVKGAKLPPPQAVVRRRKRTPATLRAEQIITYFTARWPIETTFQEMRAHLGFETPRQRVAKSVLRTAPCLLGLFSMICLIFAAHARRHRIRLRTTTWYTKTEPTFSDAIATVRRLFWSTTIFERSSHNDAFHKIPGRLRNLLLDHLSRAA